MPNKTIYVADDDLPLLKRAQELAGGSLSAAVARALRRFVEVQELRAQGFQEITVPVGRAGGQQRKRFVGYRLARWRHRSAEGRRTEQFTVYATAKGRYAVHVRRTETPDWNDPATWSADWEDWSAPSDHSLEVFETLEGLRQAVPEELARIVEENQQERPVEDLDI